MLDVIERLAFYARADIEVRRIALNMDQVRAYAPPPNFAKETDSRYAAYVERFGTTACWELDALPQTPNGKLDKRALPAPEADAFGQAEYQAPEGEAETLLAAIWQELLGVERVGRDDDFFALGGHSMLAMGLMARM